MMMTMKLKDFFGAIKSVAATWGANEKLEAEITGLAFDSRQVKPGSIFFAVLGTTVDGHQYIAEAVKRGAIALIVERIEAVPKEFSGAVLVVKDVRVALNQYASVYFGRPADRLFCVGVTGTNGKTTITHMIESILNHGKKPTAVIGTINHHFGAKIWQTDMTTPDPISFQSRLKEFVDMGAWGVALEVSSHAIAQRRVDDVPFDVAVFTNLTRDHLDYHKTMEGYFSVKRSLFTDILGRSTKPKTVAVVNVDDEYGAKIQPHPSVALLTYGTSRKAQLRFDIMHQDFEGTEFQIRSALFARLRVKLAMPGAHNVFNACAALGVAMAAGMTIEICNEALSTFPGVKGRLERVLNRQGFNVFIDYAHTDDAIKTVLHYLGEIRRSTRSKCNIITVFGCGGDRDRGKRALMLRAAVDGSDFVVATSDNPRNEDPELILNEILAGVDASLVGSKVFREVDRKAGIARALSMAKKGDVVLIAGKGHEEYQLIGDQKIPFSDVDVVRKILA